MFVVRAFSSFILFMLIAFSCLAVNFTGDEIDLTPYSNIYESGGLTMPVGRIELDKQLETLKRVNEVGDNKPKYLYVFDLLNDSLEDEILIEINGSIIDEIEVYLFDDKELIYFDVGGYFYPRETLPYTFTLPIEKKSGVTAVFKLQSRYSSGPINFYAIDPSEFWELDSKIMIVAYFCMGGMIFLGLYNLFLFVGIRDNAYLYYSVYLFSTVLGWATIFVVTMRFLGTTEVALSILPFYIGQIFSTLFCVKFLNLSLDRNPYLFRFACFLIIVNVLYLISFPFLENYYVIYKSLMHVSSVWLAFTLFAGIYRWKQGFVPARFFVLGFSMVALGGVFSILPGMGVDVGFKYFYLLTLICQGLDLLFLAIALADRISQLRREKDRAIRHAYSKDMEMLKVEQSANQSLIESNRRLQEALDITKQEGKKKQNFLMMASHELKTPLNAMVQTAYELEGEHLNAGIIRQGVERLALVIDEVTVFAQLTAGGMKAVKNTFLVKNVIDDLVIVQKTFRPEITIDVLGDCSDVLVVDRYLLSMVLRSVLDNACKYSKGGHVRISYEYDGSQEVSNWIIEDDGDGIKSEDLEQLLKPFEQKSQGFSREQEGMGLGLFVVKHVLDVLNGNVQFESSSELGGAKVVLIVPAEKTVSSVCNAEKAIQKALIVEDNPVNALVLTSILKKLDMESDIAVNGLKAVEMVTDSEYDVIFMDLQMPVMDGFEATKCLKNQGYAGPIIAVTADSESGARERCLELGMEDVVLKPVKVSDIQSCLEVLQGLNTRQVI